MCPAFTRKGLFTTAVMNNIDHNPTATTATTSFHGTSISLFQHLSTDNDGEKRESIRIKDSKIKRVPELPGFYFYQILTTFNFYQILTVFNFYQILTSTSTKY